MAGAGELDRRITIQRAANSQNDFGEDVPVWSNLTTIWAGRFDVSDREQIAAGQVNASLTSRFKVRSSTTTRTITGKDRIVYEDTTWGIQGVKETTEGRNRFLWITATRQAD